MSQLLLLLFTTIIIIIIITLTIINLSLYFSRPSSLMSPTVARGQAKGEGYAEADCHRA